MQNNEKQQNNWVPYLETYFRKGKLIIVDSHRSNNRWSLRRADRNEFNLSFSAGFFFLYTGNNGALTLPHADGIQ